ncbi:MAG: ATP-dependent endonuclease [Gimesia sp.]|nr:ATP-dependent endonuclease [Gimesia sp.]|tara:strand:+ start:4823 stop:6634 length:1812 start_codon:yes stop_codon:yes gene_type:complete
MYISRIVVRNYRNFAHLDVQLQDGVTCIIGENNTGKSNLLRAIRLAIDANMSSQYRQLLEHDIHSDTELTKPNQVVVSVEFSDYAGKVNEEALLGDCQVEPNLARINYRYRPRLAIREEIEHEEFDDRPLSIIDDYHFEVTAGGDKDPGDVEWNEDLGKSIRFGDLQSFKVVFLPALRDVAQSLKQSYDSPLGQLLKASNFSEDEKHSLFEVIKSANEEIEKQPTIESLGQGIKKAFNDATGKAHKIDLRLGMSDPSFSSITRSLNVLFSNSAMDNFEVSRNGLGLNNLLYISMLLQGLEKRVEADKTAGQLLLFEEPEAHLHPQLQRVLYTLMEKKICQVLLTTHSTHISSHAPIESFITLSNDGSVATSGVVPKHASKLSEKETGDLNRYLDATRSTFLYSRKVLLVEGPAELFLIPILVKQLMGIDLDSHGIAVVPIFGKHFHTYAKLFGEHAIRKKCAIICDGDLKLEDIPEDTEEDDLIELLSHTIQEDDYLQIFQCPVTFERAITIPENLLMFLRTIKECGHTIRLRNFRKGIRTLCDKNTEKDTYNDTLSYLRELVLKSADDYGKARFAQTASKHVRLAKKMPSYIEHAINWLCEE